MRDLLRLPPSLCPSTDKRSIRGRERGEKRGERQRVKERDMFRHQGAAVAAQAAAGRQQADEIIIPPHIEDSRMAAEKSKSRR